MASDFLPCGTPVPVNTSNTPTFAISARSAPNAARSTLPRRRHRCRAGRRSRVSPPASPTRRAQAASGICVWPLGSHRDRDRRLLSARRAKLCQYIWMQLAKHAEGDLRPELERARAAWMKPGWSLPRQGELSRSMPRAASAATASALAANASASGVSPDQSRPKP